MDPYWRWVAQLYGPEAIKRFGGLDIVEPGLLPTGMVSIFRDRRLTWGLMGWVDLTLSIYVLSVCLSGLGIVLIGLVLGLLVL